MYTLLRVLAIEKGVFKRWSTLSDSTLQTLTLKSLYENYRSVYVELRDINNTVFWIDMQQGSHHVGLDSRVFKDWIINQTEVSFDEITKPNIDHKTSTYSIASRAGFLVTSWDRDSFFNAPQSARRDLIMQRQLPYTNYSDYHKYCLTTVTGLLHFTNAYIPTDTHQGVLIEDAMSTIRHSYLSNIGIFSLSKVCSISKHKITPDMITQFSNLGSAEIPYTNGLLIRLPLEVQDKKIALSIAGHFAIEEDSTFRRYNNEYIALNLDINDAMVDRFYKANDILDLSSIKGIINPTNSSYILKEDLKTEAALKAFLGLSQSFIIAFDNPNVYFQTQEISRMTSDVSYISTQTPLGPVIDNEGFCPEHWSTKDKYGVRIRLAHPTRASVEDRKEDISASSISSTVEVSQSRVDYDYFLERKDKQYLKLLEIGRDIF